MAGFFKRKPRDWREDDYIFLEDLKKEPLKEMSSKKIIPESSVPEVSIPRVETVKERLERMQHSNSVLGVRNRFGGLQQKSSITSKPLNNKFLNENVVNEEKKVESPENNLLKDLEKSLKECEGIRNKMENANSFLSLFYDLKQAEKKFLEVLSRVESEMVEIPEHLTLRVNNIKSKIRMIK